MEAKWSEWLRSLDFPAFGCVNCGSGRFDFPCLDCAVSLNIHTYTRSTHLEGHELQSGGAELVKVCEEESAAPEKQYPV